MANWDVCCDWMLDNEDRRRECKPVPDPVSPHPTDGMTEEEKQAEIKRAKNAQAITGINSYYFKEWFDQIAALPQDQRLAVVKQFYKFEFWNGWYDRLNSDEVGKRVLDASVNMGTRTGVKLLQRAINASVNPATPRIGEDGKWGPITVDSANSVLDSYLVIEFKRVRLNYYQDIVQREPYKQKYLGTADHPGAWWIRATK